MKRLFYVATLCLVACTASFAQNAITEEELQKYAIAMDSIDGMRKDLIETISELVKNNEHLTAARYNELSKIINDDSKLAEAKATAEEIAALREIIAAREAGTAKINETFQSLAKDFIGAATYNKVRKALTEDPEIKSKYEAILASLQAD